MSDMLVSSNTSGFFRELGVRVRRNSDYDPVHNPFSVRYVQPGAIPFFFDPKQIGQFRNADSAVFHQYLLDAIAGCQEAATWVGASFLADRFEKFGYRAQIVGPHGSGKSTLMSSLQKVWEKRGIPLFSWSLHDQQRFLPRDFWQTLSARQEEAARNAPVPIVLFLDGYEQLSFYHRFMFGQYCRKNKLGYLISAHQPVMRVPTLFRTSVTPSTVRRLVDYLIDDDRFFPTDEEVQDLFHRNRGNCRSILFDLYDLYEEAAFGEI